MKGIEFIEYLSKIDCTPNKFYKCISLTQNGNKKIVEGNNGSYNDPFDINVGQKSRNARNVYLKFCKYLYVLDFDTKNNIEQNELFKFCKSQNTIYCETNKGYHFYFFILNVPREKTNITKCYMNNEIDFDFIGHNVFVPNKRIYNGDKLKRIDFDNIKQYFDLRKFENNPPPTKTKTISVVKKDDTVDNVFNEPNQSVATKDDTSNNVFNEPNQTIIEYLKIVKPENYDDFFKISCFLKRSNYRFEVFHEWAKTSSKYGKGNLSGEDYCNKFWNDGIDKYNYNIGTLENIVYRIDSEKYFDLKRSVYNKLIMKYIKKNTQKHLAILIKEILGEFYCINTQTSDYIFPDENGIWQFLKEIEIRKKFSFIGEIIENEKIYFNKNISKEDLKNYKIFENKKLSPKEKEELLVDVNQEELLLKFVSKTILENTYKMCYNTKSKKEVMESLKEEVYNGKIEAKLDETNKYVLGFNNGVYDLENNIFRTANLDEYITKSVKYSFNPKSNEIIRKKIFEVLESIFNEDEIIEYFLTILSSCLVGGNKYEKIYCLSGSGGNGKGLLDTLTRRVFGEYYATIPSEYFVNKNGDTSKANPELHNAKASRMLVSTECDKSQKFISSKMKKLSGGDPEKTRGLYGSPIDWIPQFTMFIQSNGLPSLTEIDKGVKRRIVVIDFPNQFVDDPKHGNEQKADPDLKDAFSSNDEYRDEFLLILIEYYNKNVKGKKELIIPQQIIEATKKYLLASDYLAQFFEAKDYIITHNENDCNVEPEKLFSEFRQETPEIWHDSGKIGRNQFYKMIEQYEGISKRRIRPIIDMESGERANNPVSRICGLKKK